MTVITLLLIATLTALGTSGAALVVVGLAAIQQHRRVKRLAARVDVLAARLSGIARTQAELARLVHDQLIAALDAAQAHHGLPHRHRPPPVDLGGRYVPTEREQEHWRDLINRYHPGEGPDAAQ